MKRKFLAPKVTSIGVSTEQMIAASKPDIPIVTPEELPYEYNSKDWTEGDTHWTGISGNYMDLYVNNGVYIIRKDLLDLGSFGDFFESLGGYLSFNASHKYQGCYIYEGTHPGLIYGQKYLLYKSISDGQYYYILCNQ